LNHSGIPSRIAHVISASADFATLKWMMAVNFALTFAIFVVVYEICVRVH